MSGSNVLPTANGASRLIQKPTLARTGEHALSASLIEILQLGLLHPVFQPIVDLRTGALIGYEGLIRGPQGSPLHAPLHLFEVARQCDLGLQLESRCIEIILKKFVALNLPGRIFLNISPDFLSDAGFAYREKLAQLEQIGLPPRRIILELTENQATCDYAQMRDVLSQCRDLGFQIAIDDLGEGFSSLRLWSEILPEYVKIDMHFIQGINRDPVKLQFVQSIQQIAIKAGLSQSPKASRPRKNCACCRNWGSTGARAPILPGLMRNRHRRLPANWPRESATILPCQAQETSADSTCRPR